MPSGIEKYHWEKSDTPSDYWAATIYWRVMQDRFYESSVTFADANSNAAFALDGMEARANHTTRFNPLWMINQR